MECISLVSKEDSGNRNASSHVRRRPDLPRLGEGDTLTSSGSTEKVSSLESTESDGEVATIDLLSSSSCRISKESLSNAKGKAGPRFSAHREPTRVKTVCLGCGEKIGENGKTEISNRDAGLEISVTMNKKTLQLSGFIVTFFLTVAILRVCIQCFTCWKL